MGEEVKKKEKYRFRKPDLGVKGANREAQEKDV